MYRLFTIIICCGFGAGSLFAQEDSVFLYRKPVRKAAIETVGINLGIWAFDKFALNADYAQINFHSMRHNLKSGFVWDNDHFSTNLLGHPYHGGFYFNAARSNGLNFWQSAPFTVGGSLMWEYLMENERPSINDFISTPVGGLALGEITYRLSDLLIDNRTAGWNRFGREALTMLVSPGRGLNRILSGEAWTSGTYKGNAIADEIPVTFYAGAGYRGLAEDSARTRYYNGIYLDLKLNYGSLFSEDHEKPYDAFLAQISFNFSQQPVIGRVNISGQLWGKSHLMKDRITTLHWGVFQHFDYYDSNTVWGKQKASSYRIAEAAAFGIGAQLKTNLRRNTLFAMSLHLNGILLGGSITDHYRMANRDYNLGSGFSSKLLGGLLFGKKASLGFNVEDYRLFTWKGYSPETNLDKLTDEEQKNLSIQGDKGSVSFTIASFLLNYRFHKHFIFSTETSLYLRKSFYDCYPDVEYRIMESKIGVGYLF